MELIGYTKGIELRFEADLIQLKKGTILRKYSRSLDAHSYDQMFDNILRLDSSINFRKGIADQKIFAHIFHTGMADTTSAILSGPSYSKDILLQEDKFFRPHTCLNGLEADVSDYVKYYGQPDCLTRISPSGRIEVMSPKVVFVDNTREHIYIADAEDCIFPEISVTYKNSIINSK